MLIIGELINASRKKIAEAIKTQDAAAISRIAVAQKNSGADFIDVNAGIFVDDEEQYLTWLVQTVQEATAGAPCCIDSPNPRAIEAALKVHQGAPMINSISLEKDRWEMMLPLLAGSDCKVVALCMHDEGMPESAADRVSIAGRLISQLEENNVDRSNIFVDPLVQPIATNHSYGMEFLNAIEGIMTTFPGVHTICGLSNISYGLPERKLLNQSFMLMALCKGLDAAIVDPLDKRMMGNIRIGEALTAQDEYCMNYIDCYRSDGLKFD